MMAKPTNPGMTPGIIACILAALGIFWFGIIFALLAAIVALVGTISAVKNQNTNAIWVNVLAWILIVVVLVTSPILWLAIGIAILFPALGVGS